MIRSFGTPNFGIHRIDGNRLYPHQEVSLFRFGPEKLQVSQGFKVCDGEISIQSNGFHDLPLY